MIIRRALIAVALVLGTGCDSRYETVELERVAGADDASVQRDGLSVPEGHVLVFRAQPRAIQGRRDFDVEDRVELRIGHRSVAKVEPGVLADTWMLFGRAAGQTALEVRVNGVVEERIDVTVTPSAPGGA